MARTPFFALACGMLSAASALEVTSPSAGLATVAGRTYTVEWTGTGSNQRFEIDLFYCGSYCTDDDCGEWATALCPYGEDGCPDNEGDYDVVLPEPMTDMEGYGYKVRVMNVNDESDMDCSDAFSLLSADDTSDVADEDEPSLTVTSPSEGDMAVAGEEYTVEWDYDNGVGSMADRFAIDLYMSEGTGDCGTFYASLCDKPSIGCKDSMGDYDIVIPEDTTSGMYSIRVGRYEEDSLYGCSGEFEVVSDESESVSFLLF